MWNFFGQLIYQPATYLTIFGMVLVLVGVVGPFQGKVSDSLEGKYDPGKGGRIAACAIGVITIVAGIWLSLKTAPQPTVASQAPPASSVSQSAASSGSTGASQQEVQKVRKTKKERETAPSAPPAPKAADSPQQPTLGPPQFKNVKIHGVGTGLLYCDPRVLIDGLDVTESGPSTDPAVDVGSARCQQLNEKTATYKAYAGFKASAYAHAGDRGLIESDLNTLDMSLDTARKIEGTAPSGATALATLKKQVLDVADDKEKTRALISRIVITGRQ